MVVVDVDEEEASWWLCSLCVLKSSCWSGVGILRNVKKGADIFFFWSGFTNNNNNNKYMQQTVEGEEGNGRSKKKTKGKKGGINKA